MKHLIECAKNVRYGRMALRWGSIVMARGHINCARYWLVQATFDGGGPRTAALEKRRQKVLGLVNELALDVIFAEAGCTAMVLQ